MILSHAGATEALLQNIERLYVIAFEFRNKIPLINTAPFPHRRRSKTPFVIKGYSAEPSRNPPACGGEAHIRLFVCTVGRGGGRKSNPSSLENHKIVPFYSGRSQMNSPAPPVNYLCEREFEIRPAFGARPADLSLCC